MGGFLLIGYKIVYLQLLTKKKKKYEKENFIRCKPPVWTNVH